MQDRLYITEFARNAANAIEKAKLSREILFGPGKRGKEIPLSLGSSTTTRFERSANATYDTY